MMRPAILTCTVALFSMTTAGQALATKPASAAPDPAHVQRAVLAALGRPIKSFKIVASENGKTLALTQSPKHGLDMFEFDHASGEAESVLYTRTPLVKAMKGRVDAKLIAALKKFDQEQKPKAIRALRSDLAGTFQAFWVFAKLSRQGDLVLKGDKIFKVSIPLVGEEPAQIIERDRWR